MLGSAVDSASHEPVMGVHQQQGEIIRTFFIIYPDFICLFVLVSIHLSP